MTNITKVREGNAKFDLHINDSIPEMFSDGVSHMFMGNPVSKLTFHSVTTPATSKDEIEQRKGVLLLTIPTSVLLEMCRNILYAAQSNIDAYSDAGKLNEAKVSSIMSGVSISSSTILKSNVSQIKKPEVKK